MNYLKYSEQQQNLNFQILRSDTLMEILIDVSYDFEIFFNERKNIL